MKSTLEILYIAPDATSVESVTSVLETDWEVSVCTDFGDFSVEGVDEQVDCIIYDDGVEDLSGVEFYNKNRHIIDHIPFVLFSDTDNTVYLQRAIRSGIDDVVMKNIDVEMDGGVDTKFSFGSADASGTRGEISMLDDQAVALRYRVATLLLDKEMAIEEVIFSSIRSLLGAADDELSVKIDFALESLGESLGATKCVVYKYTEFEDEDDTAVYERINEWCDSDVESDEPSASVIGSEEIDKTEYPGHETHAKQFEKVCRDWTPTSNMPIHPNSELERDSVDIGTFVSYPLVIDFELQGVIAVTTKYPRTWEERVTRQIKSLGEVIITTKRQRDNRIRLEEQNERLEQFTSVISHDLKNPLAVAKGYVDMSLDKGELFNLEESANALQRMEDMIDELLTLAKQGEAIGETAATDVATVVNNSWNNLDTKEATLVTEDLESIPKPQADSSRLQEALENLIKNAIDHVGDDVEITIRRIENGVAVGDDGEGIPEDERDQIFERGYTGGNGTGFGLAIVEEVVDAHGWELSLSESADGGAEFQILFGNDE